jgi:competence protein ComEC
MGVMQRWGIVIGGIAWLVGIALAAILGLRAGAVPLVMGLILLAGAIAATLFFARGNVAGRGRQIGLAAPWAIALLLLALARFAFSLPGNDPGNVAHLGFGQQYTVQGTVTGEPDVRVKGEFIVVDVQQVAPGSSFAWRPAQGTVQIYALGLTSEFLPEYGDTVEATGTLNAPVHTPPGIDGDLGAARTSVIARGGGTAFFGALYAAREGLASALGHSLPAPEAALIIGILLGLKTPTLRARLPLFVRTGTIHLVVTSGLKVTLAAELAARLARPLGRWLSMIASLLFVVGYVLLSGAGPAAVRAGIMGAILILARFTGRDYDVLNALALACFLMTLVTPDILWDAGFQLSAAGTLGIAILAPRLRAPLLAWLGRWRLGRVVADVLAATLAAQIATLPIVAITFGVVSFVALPVNVLLVPFLPIFLVLGAVVGIGGLLGPGIGAALGAVAWLPLRLADLIIEWTASWPFAAVTVSSVPVWLTPAWVIALGWVPLLWRPPTSPSAVPHAPPKLPAPLRLGIALAVALTLVTGAVASAATVPPARLTVTFLDVPGGPATLIRAGDGRTALIDGGADGPSLLSALADALPFWQRTLDLVLVTDVRAGHFAGLVSLLGAYHIGMVADPGVLHPTPAYVAWYADLLAAHIPQVTLTRGATITLAPDARLDVLAPTRPLNTGASQEDTNALILRLVSPGLAILFAGDADELALAAATQNTDVRADVVQFCLLANEAIVLRTGWADLVLQAQPRMVIITPSARPAPKAGTIAAAPAPDDPAALLNATALRTNQTGALTLTSDGTGWRATPGAGA